METLESKIRKAVKELINSAPDYKLAEYEDDYDGFTHSTYEGLIDSIWEEMDNEGHGNSVSMKVVRDFAYEMF